VDTRRFKKFNVILSEPLKNRNITHSGIQKMEPIDHNIMTEHETDRTKKYPKKRSIRDREQSFGQSAFLTSSDI